MRPSAGADGSRALPKASPRPPLPTAFDHLGGLAGGVCHGLVDLGIGLEPERRYLAGDFGINGEQVVHIDRIGRKAADVLPRQLQAAGRILSAAGDRFGVLAMITSRFAGTPVRPGVIASAPVADATGRAGRSMAKLSFPLASVSITADCVEARYNRCTRATTTATGSWRGVTPSGHPADYPQG